MFKSFIMFFSFLFVVNSFAVVVATIGKKKITTKEVAEKLRLVRSQSINPPSPKMFLQDLINFEVGVLEARKQKVHLDKDFKDRVKKELYKVFLKKQLSKSLDRLEVSKREMRRYYKKNPEVNTSHILIEAPFQSTYRQKARAKKKALKVLSYIQSGKKSFEESVKLYSDDKNTRYKKGNLGYMGEASLVPQYYKAANSLRPGQVYNGITKSVFGYHIIKLKKKKSYKYADKTQIRIALLNKKRKEVFGNYFKKLKRKYKIYIDKNAVVKIK